MKKNASFAIAATLLLASSVVHSAEYREAATDYGKAKGFGRAVVTQGGKTVWLAGQTALVDLNGKDISYNFEAQMNTILAQIDRTLKMEGGSLKNLVRYTIYIKDPRNGPRASEIRVAAFKDTGKYPGSALLTIEHFAEPGMEVAIQGEAVIGDTYQDAK